MEDIIDKCPVFGKDECPYRSIAVEFKGIVANCPAFKSGCPFKEIPWERWWKKLAQMRDTINPEGSAAFLKLNQKVDEISKEAEKKSGLWPFPANT